MVDSCYCSGSIKLCKGTANTELANTEIQYSSGRCRVRFLRASGHIFVNLSIHNLILCVFLLKDTLFNIYC